MQSVLLPKGLCDEIDSIVWSFLWGHTVEGKKINLVDWNAVCKPKDNGGLGIRKASMLNKGYMMKLAWRFLSRPFDLWSNVLTSKYLAGHPSDFSKTKKTTLSLLWRGILSVVIDSTVGPSI